MSNEARNAYEAAFSETPRFLSRAPGRVNLIGEHTDYNAGLVLPVGIDRYLEIAAGFTKDPGLHLFAKNLEERADFPELPPVMTGSFADYVVGMARLLDFDRFLDPKQQDPHRRGIRLAISSQVPVGAGLSSSAALLVAAGRLFCHLLRRELSGLDLAQISQRVENEFVGVDCGLMDPFCSASAKPNRAVFLDCQNLESRLVPFPSDRAEILVLDTKVHRGLRSSDYNQRRRECEQAVQALREQFDPGISSLRDVDRELLERAGPSLGPVQRRRAEHVISENARVLETIRAFEEDRLDEVGRLMVSSHESLRDSFEVSCPELDFFVQAALRESEVFGARMTGAGFGGCAIALVAAGEGERVGAVLARLYREEFNRAGVCFAVKVEGEAKLVDRDLPTP